MVKNCSESTFLCDFLQIIVLKTPFFNRKSVAL